MKQSRKNKQTQVYLIFDKKYKLISISKSIAVISFLTGKTYSSIRHALQGNFYTFHNCYLRAIDVNDEIKLSEILNLNLIEFDQRFGRID